MSVEVLKAELLAKSAKLDGLDPESREYMHAHAEYLAAERLYVMATAPATLCIKRTAERLVWGFGYNKGPVIMPSKGKTICFPIPERQACAYIKWTPKTSNGARLFEVFVRPVGVGL